MRKPLVGACLTISAVLLAGGIAAATTAGAQTTADEPVMVAAPDLSAVPELPAAPPAVVEPPVVVQTSPGPDPTPTVTRPVATPSVAEEPAEEPAARPTREKPAPPKTAGPADGAHRDVTPASVSGSADAPVQRQVLALVNEHRERAGCDRLTIDQRLVNAASRHAAEMARHGYFAHRSLDGRGAAERVSDAGYPWSRYGENIARGQDSPAEVMAGWMDSPEHRENILDCRFEQMGIGLAFADGRPYWVQDFATPA